MRLRQLTLIVGLVLLTTFTMRAQNAQVGYYPHPPGTTHEKLYVNSQGAPINNLTIIDVPTLKVIVSRSTSSLYPSAMLSPCEVQITSHGVAPVYELGSTRLFRSVI